MEFTKIALTAAIVAASSSLAIAQPAIQGGNTATVETEVLVYVAAGLTVEVTQQLMFSDIVIPATGSGQTSGMSMDCESGDVTYANAGSNPNGPNVLGAANANGNKQIAQVGQIQVVGEPDYAISVSASVGANVPDFVTFTPLLGWNNNKGTIQRSLNSNGKKKVAFCGSVSVTEEVQTSSELKVPVSITINYR